jgi:archaemetzincin
MFARRTFYWPLFVLLATVSVATAEKKTRTVSVAPASPTLAQIDQARAQLKPLHTPLGKPAPGDWLAAHKEKGQTFTEYRRAHPQRTAPNERKIYIQPLGAFSETEQKLIDATADLLGRYYNTEVKRLPIIAGLTIPAEARRKNPYTGGEQILTTYVLEKLLVPQRPKDAAAVLALSATDLWPGEGWNFVFGQALPSERVGVWSIARYGDPTESDEAYQLCLLRTLKVASHETGHMYGFDHCTAWACGMNGSNSAEEMDRGPLAFCPECSAKIWWACQCKPAAWFESLEGFADKHHLDDQAAFWKRSRAALGK